MDETTELNAHITKLALDHGTLTVGFTKIRRIEPVIVLAFPYSDKWFFKEPFTLSKRLGDEYGRSKIIQNEIFHFNRCMRRVVEGAWNA